MIYYKYNSVTKMQKIQQCESLLVEGEHMKRRTVINLFFLHFVAIAAVYFCPVKKYREKMCIFVFILFVVLIAAYKYYVIQIEEKVTSLIDIISDIKALQKIRENEHFYADSIKTAEKQINEMRITTEEKTREAQELVNVLKESAIYTSFKIQRKIIRLEEILNEISETGKE